MLLLSDEFVRKKRRIWIFFFRNPHYFQPYNYELQKKRNSSPGTKTGINLMPADEKLINSKNTYKPIQELSLQTATQVPN
jgi:hypothetical protein